MTHVRRFNRYELKYVISSDAVAAIIADLQTLALPDSHGGTAGYRVVSLYYDSADLNFFWHKVEGIKFRRKLRIRIYPADDIEQVEQAMVEIKQRINRTVQKRRLCLPIGQAEALCSGQFPEADLDALDRQAADEVRYMVHALDLRPTCVTAYRRRAFIGGQYDAGLRITFDTDLRGRGRHLRVDAAAENNLWAPPDICVMEVKVNETVPDWVTSLLARHNCQLRRVSKYCTALAAARGIQPLPFSSVATPAQVTAPQPMPDRRGTDG